MLHFTTHEKAEKRNMKNKKALSPSNTKWQRVADLLEHLIAVEMYKGGAGQREIAKSMHMSLGKINGFVKGVKTSKENHGEE